MITERSEFDGGDATRDDFTEPFDVPTWIITRHVEDGPKYDEHWVVIGSEKDAYATLHFYLQDVGCQVCGASETEHADGSIDPFPHPYETNDTDDEIDNRWQVRQVVIMERKE